MKQIDIKDMLQTLESQLRGVRLFLANKYNDSKPKQQAGLFDLFESDYNKDITLEVDKVSEMFNNVADKVKNILIDVEQCGVHFEDFKKASSDFYKYCQKNKEKRERETFEYFNYQQELFKQVKENVNTKMLDHFNNTFSEVKEDKYFHNYKRKKGGSTKKNILFDAIYCEITNLPSNRLNDCFDEKGHFLRINDIPYDTSMVTRNGINSDIDGNPLFTFQYKRMSNGFFECIRVKIGNEWFVLYERL